MRNVYVAGVGMHACGRFLEKSLKELTYKAVWDAIHDSEIDPRAIQAAYVGNAYAGLTTGQESIRGEVALNYCGFEGIAMVNVENACASGSTAFREAWIGVAAGLYDVAIAVGVEKLHCDSTSQSLKALSTSTDIESMGSLGVQFSGLYAMKLKNYMETYDVSVETLAEVVVKNSQSASLNPNAQIRKVLTAEDVLHSKLIADPITLYMVTPISDGAAAAVLCSEQFARKAMKKPKVKIAASSLKTGYFTQAVTKGQTVAERTSQEAYKMAGIGPEDVDLVELHDAIAPGELHMVEELGLCGPGEAPKLIRDKRTSLQGDIPVNPSGGLVSRGHPVGATGLAQIAEAVWQLRNEAGPRQVAGRNGKGPRIALTQNAGGRLENDTAVGVIHIFEKV